MFTGIIETTGFVKFLLRRKGIYRLRVLPMRRLSPLKKGESLSINGVCLTLVDAKKDSLFFDVVEETFTNTSFRYLRCNDVVNIERSLGTMSKIDGHFVLGHVDKIQKIKAIKSGHRAFVDISISKDDKKYIVKKGSIAIDGISLTVGEIYDDRIRIHLIPYTLVNTNLKYKKVGHWVNVEFDILGKYTHICNLYQESLSS